MAVKIIIVLYTEADGVSVRLQREGKQKRCELKNAIAYEGWERLPQRDERYRTVNKVVYFHGGDVPGTGQLWFPGWHPCNGRPACFPSLGWGAEEHDSGWIPSKVKQHQTVI